VTLAEAYRIIAQAIPAAKLHADHICEFLPGAHAAGCPAGNDAYTAASAAEDTIEELQKRVGYAVMAAPAARKRKTIPNDEDNPMNKLSKTHIKDRDEVIAKLREDRDKLQAAVDAFNATRDVLFTSLTAAITLYNDELSEAFVAVANARDDYNATLTLADDWKGDIANQIEEYIGERADKWHESDKGQAVTAWKEAFEEGLEEVEIEDPAYVEVDEPQELTIEAQDAADALEQIPEEAE